MLVTRRCARVMETATAMANAMTWVSVSAMTGMLASLACLCAKTAVPAMETAVMARVFVMMVTAVRFHRTALPGAVLKTVLGVATALKVVASVTLTRLLLTALARAARL